LVLLSRQPVTLCTTVNDNAQIISINLREINGLQYADLDVNDLSYPLSLTLAAGSNTLNPLLEMALLQRVTQHVASRGDDTVVLSSDYWDRISAMMGKGIG
jgi:hypothetical protein